MIDYIFKISKCNPVAGSSYIKLPKELNHPKKGLINVHNIDYNECFKWFLVRYLHLADHHPARITKADKDLARKLDFKDIECPVKIRDVHKSKQKNLITNSVFGNENKEKYFSITKKT